MIRHYLDHASGSPLRPEVKTAIAEALEVVGPDPGRLYEDARGVRHLIEQARSAVAAFFCVTERQVIFTAGGTEAVFTATHDALSKKQGHIACALVEHASVRESATPHGIVKLAVDHEARLTPENVASVLGAFEQDIALLHCQLANHEVGTVQPIAHVIEAAHKYGVPVHTDVVAANGHMAIDLGALGVQYASCSAAGLGGPPGIGALIIKKGHRLEAMLKGSAQERGRRAGAEDVLGIVGFGAAAQALGENNNAQLLAEQSNAFQLSTALANAALRIDGMSLVGPKDASSRLSHLVAVGAEDIEAEAILIGLDRLGFAIHSGSACAQEIFAPSPVLEAMGLPDHMSLRLSVGWTTSNESVQAFGSALDQVVSELRSYR